MILNSIAVLRRTPFFLIHSSSLYSPKHPSFSHHEFTLFASNPLHRSNFSSQTSLYGSIFSNKELGFYELSKKQLGKGFSRISAVSDDGSGGSFGGNGGKGFGGSGDDGAGDAGGKKSKWNFLSW